MDDQFFHIILIILCVVALITICILLLWIRQMRAQIRNSNLTEQELREAIDDIHQDGLLESDEKQMIHNVFDMGDANAKDVMVPRVHITFAKMDDSYEDLLALFRQDMYTRLPVYEETTDHVTGFINMKDLFLFNDPSRFHVKDILREVFFTYEYKNISELLTEMRQASISLAIVLDEYGETAGLITLEDLLEEIVGEIRDEYDEHEEDLVKEVNEGEYLVNGSISLDDLNDRLHLSLDSQDYDSLGGLLIDYLDRIVEEGDEITTKEGLRLIVEKVVKNRAELVRLYLPRK